jgi:DNA-binding beta-propeller fold protein YncE
MFCLFTACLVSPFVGTILGGISDGIGTSASLNAPRGIALDNANTLVFVTEGSRIRQITIATGAVTTVAGSGLSQFLDAIGAEASFSSPWGLVIDMTDSNLFTADSQNHRIRQVHIATRAVTTLAGSGAASLANGAGTNAAFQFPRGLAIDNSSTRLFVADSGNNRICQILIATGQVTTLAGSTTRAFADGIGALASFSKPVALAIDRSSTRLFVSDTTETRIRQVVIATQAVSTLAGSGAVGFADGAGAFASIDEVPGMMVDGSGSFIYFADSGNDRVRKLSIASGAVTTIAGGGASLNGTCSAANITKPQAVAADSSGMSYYVVTGSRVVTMSFPVTGVPCRAGYVCPGSGVVASCPLGTYCPSGSSAVSPCTIGGFCSSTGMSLPTVCTPGSFCGATQLSAPSGKCSAGFFCPAGSSSSTQSPCLGGVYCPPGQNASDAFPCMPGTYCAAMSTNQTVCPSGSFCPVTRLSSPQTCPGGQFCNYPGLTRSYPAPYCTAGQYLVGTTCTSCPIGAACVGESWNAVAALCVGGTYQGNVSQTTCLTCNLGTYCGGAGATAPTPCPPGFACTAAGQSNFTVSCSAGHFCPAGSSSPTAQACPAGFYCSAGASVGTARPCSAGKYCPIASSTLDHGGPCTGGYYCAAGADRAPCSPGYFCPAGAVTLNQGGPCTPGAYCPVASPSAAGSGPCPAGFYCLPRQDRVPCAAGTASAGGQSACADCAAGTFQKYAGQGNCTACASGTTSTARAQFCTGAILACRVSCLLEFTVLIFNFRVDVCSSYFCSHSSRLVRR